MSELEALYWIWVREIKRYYRDKTRVISSIIQPLLFLLIFGSGFSFVKIGNLDYNIFLFPGIVIMSLVAVSITSGISVIWDREFGFLKEILVAPISRFTIFFGKALSGCTIAMIQGILILSFSLLFGINLKLQIIIMTLFIMMLVSLGMVSLGLLIASFVESIESFGVIMNFIVFPLIFFSGILYPLNQAPYWLKFISYFDPLTYGVELMRYIIINSSLINPITCLVIIISFSSLTILFGSLSFNRQK